MNFNNIIFDSNLHEDEELLPFVAVADDEEPTREDHFSDILPVMPLKNTVLFPGVIIPITVGRNKSIRAVTKSQDGEKYIIVLTQKIIKQKTLALTTCILPGLLRVLLNY